MSESSEESAPWWRARDETGTVIDHSTTIQHANEVIEGGVETVLGLGYRLIGCEGMAAIYKKLNLNSALVKVDLTCNMLGDEGAGLFFGAVTKVTGLARVDVSGNMIGGKGGEAIAECLKVNRSITKLSVFHNELGDQGCSAIAKALHGNITLHSLNLRENKMTDASGRNFITALQDHNQTLHVLWLRNNRSTQPPEKNLTTPLPSPLRAKLPLLSQEHGLFYNDLSGEVLGVIKKALIQRNVESGGRKSKMPEKWKASFWTPPPSPEPAEVDEAVPQKGKKKK